MSTFRIPKPRHGSDEWHLVRWHDPDTRLKRISASVAAAVHGQHKYMSKAALAAMLLAPEPPRESESTAPQERGHRLEQALVQFAADNLKQHMIVGDLGEMYVAGRLIATLDAAGFRTAVRDPQPVFSVECKTDNDYFAGVLSPTWHWQGVQQAICTGTDEVWWSILDGRLAFHLFHQPVTAADKVAHAQACEDFLGWIDMGVMPPDCEPTAADIATVHPWHVEGKTVELDEMAVAALDEYVAAASAEKRAKARRESAKSAIAAALQDAETGTMFGHPVVTWKSNKNGVRTLRPC